LLFTAGINGNNIIIRRPSINLQNKITPPDWWKHSEAVWQELNSFIDLNNLNIKQAVFDSSYWSEVEGGITNFNYKLSIKENEYFIQVLDAEKIKRLPMKQFVPTNMVMEKNAQLQKWLIPCLHETETLRVFDWLDAEHTSSDIFFNEKLEFELFEFLSVLHSSISILPILNIKEHLQHYHLLALEKNPTRKDEFDSHYKNAMSCAESFVPSKNCHNDLSPGNILFSKDRDHYKFYVIDWEYACISDPFFDLAGICVNFGLSEAQEKKLIQNYSQNLSLYPSFDKFNKMKELYQIINLLWSA